MKVALLKKIRKNYKVVDYFNTTTKRSIYQLLYKGKPIKYLYFEKEEGLKDRYGIPDQDWRVLIYATLYNIIPIYCDYNNIKSHVQYERMLRKDKKLKSTQIQRDVKLGKVLYP